MVGCLVQAAWAVDYKLDFGTATSPAQTGWVAVHDQTRYDNGSAVNLGDGVTAGIAGWNTVQARDRGAGTGGDPANDDLLRDFMESNLAVGTAWFEVRGLAPGTYDITLYVGDPSFPSADERIILNGIEVDMPEWPGAGGTFPDDWAVTVEDVAAGAGGTIWLAEAPTPFGKVAGMVIAPGEPDLVEPAAVTNLSVTDADTTTVALSWTAPPDDLGAGGNVASYDLRYSTTLIDAANFASATPVAVQASPGLPGQTESFVVGGLTAETPYYFAIKSSDASGNVSALSNVATGTTQPPDVTAPGAITNLAIGSVGTRTVELTWTAPGDDGSTGQASVYDVRYATSAIVTDADFNAAFQVTDDPAPQTAGSTETFTVGSLSSETTYWFAVKTSDEVPHASALSNVVSTTTQAGSAFYVTDVTVSSVSSTPTTYGQVWTGRVTYDIDTDAPEVWAWLEVSFDGGATWEYNQTHVIGHAATITPGTGLEIQWLMDTAADVNVLTDCQFRVRVNEDPEYYVQNDTLALDTMVDSPNECPKPIPQDDPYTMLEMMINRGYHGHDLTDIGTYAYLLPGLTHTVSVAKGPEMLVGMAAVDRPAGTYPPFEHLKFKATYIKVGDMEFAIISKNSIRTAVEVVTAEKQAIEAALGIPQSNILINCCHVHYTDNGEVGTAECVAALTQAKASAVPAEMAVLHLRTGSGYNYTRQGSAGGFTDGPLDDNLFCVLFRDYEGSPIGSWVRFTGHSAIDTSNLMCRSMESRWGGVCAFFNGGAGTMNTAWSNVGGNYDPVHMADLMMAEVPAAQFKRYCKLGVSSAWTVYYGVDTLIQTTRIGDYYFPAYNCENPNEQALVTAALMSFDQGIVVGYANGRAGPGGGYYNWNTSSGIPRQHVYRMTQETVRAKHIVDIALDSTVSLDDLQILVAGLSGPDQPTIYPAADLDGDGDCDMTDVAILAGSSTGP